MKALVRLSCDACIGYEHQISVPQLSASGWMVYVQSVTAINRTLTNNSSSSVGCSIILKLDNQLQENQIQTGERTPMIIDMQ